VRTAIGAHVLRSEDDALLRGAGRYVDDLAVGQLRAVFVRSTVAHARLARVDVTDALAMPGVVAVFTAADLPLATMRAHRMLPDAFDREPLADGTVRFVGEPIAIVVAESRATAVDAADVVTVEYEPLGSVVDPADSLAAGAPVMFPEIGNNIVFERTAGTADEVLAGADLVVRGRFVNQRVATAPMEPDGALAVPDPQTGGLTLYASTQRVHLVRDEVAHVLGLDPQLVRVIAPQVGGGFGGKFEAAPEAVVLAAASLRLQRPIGWTQTRSENLLSMPHGRGQIQEVALAVRADGTLLGLWAELLGDAGAYAVTGSLIPNATLMMLPGTYRMERAGGSGRSVFTNTTPMGAYRGAGRPEACAIVERLVDMAAVELGVDPVDLRRRNLVGRDAFPYRSATGMTYDSGDYAACLDGLTELIGYDALRREQAERRVAGSNRLLGIGVAMWIDCTPMNRPGEYAAVRVLPGDGDALKVTVSDGAGDQGQAHRTTWAMILSDVLAVPVGAVELLAADTFVVPQGEGTGSARSLQLAGNAVAQAGRDILDQARAVAAHLLEAAPADIDATAEGRLGVVGSPARSVSWADVARAASDPASLPPDVAAALGAHGLSAEIDFVQGGPTFPAGAHAAVVEVDVETGQVRLVQFGAVDDCGRVINPVSVAGQQQGGIVQGIGQALFEEIVYDGDGNPRTTSFADYLVASAAELPNIDVRSVEVVSPVNPLGAKGIGQAGAIGSTPAVQNAVVDALAHLGVRHIDLPLGPERVWRAIGEAARRGEGPHATEGLG
jgi:aerobic carbon-monoxide dehydrogenase large subunit